MLTSGRSLEVQIHEPSRAVGSGRVHGVRWYDSGERQPVGCTRNRSGCGISIAIYIQSGIPEGGDQAWKRC